jgi:hypothetical protein
MNMSIFEVAQKVANLLKGRRIYFDFKSYDNEEDIPQISDGGKWYKVRYVRFNDEGDFLEIVTDTFGCVIGFYDITEEEFNKGANEMGLYELLVNVYYETEDSMELGDFESDFLNIL